MRKIPGTQTILCNLHENSDTMIPELVGPPLILKDKWPKGR